MFSSSGYGSDFIFMGKLVWFNVYLLRYSKIAFGGGWLYHFLLKCMLYVFCIHEESPSMTHPTELRP